MKEDSDDALIRRVCAGDESAFAELYERHRDRAWRWALDVLRHEEDAADALQDAWLYLNRALPRYEPRGRFAGLLYRVVQHAAISLLRKRRPNASLPPDPAARLTGDAGLDEALERLPTALRETLRLRVRDGLSYEEIAAAMAVPLGTVKSRIHEAVAQLRRRMVEA